MMLMNICQLVSSPLFPDKQYALSTLHTKAYKTVKNIQIKKRIVKRVAHKVKNGKGKRDCRVKHLKKGLFSGFLLR